MGVSPPTGPSEVLIWKAMITLTVVVWTARIVPGEKRRGSRACLQISSTRLVAPVLGFFGMYKPAQRSSPHPSLYHHPPTSLTEPRHFFVVCWVRLSFVHCRLSATFVPTPLPDWPKCFSLSSLITVAGMARGIVTQL